MAFVDREASGIRFEVQESATCDIIWKHNMLPDNVDRLTVHQDQLRAQRSVTSIGEHYIYF